MSRRARWLGPSQPPDIPGAVSGDDKPSSTFQLRQQRQDMAHDSDDSKESNGDNLRGLERRKSSRSKREERILVLARPASSPKPFNPKSSPVPATTSKAEARRTAALLQKHWDSVEEKNLEMRENVVPVQVGDAVVRKNKDVILKSKLRVAVGAVTQDDNKALVEGELEVQRLKAMVKQARLSNETARIRAGEAEVQLKAEKKKDHDQRMAYIKRLNGYFRSSQRAHKEKAASSGGHRNQQIIADWERREKAKQVRLLQIQEDLERRQSESLEERTSRFNREEMRKQKANERRQKEQEIQKKWRSQTEIIRKSEAKARYQREQQRKKELQAQRAQKEHSKMVSAERRKRKLILEREKGIANKRKAYQFLLENSAEYRQHMAAQREAEQLAEALETRRKQNSIIVAKQEEENRRFEYIKLRDTSAAKYKTQIAEEAEKYEKAIFVQASSKFAAEKQRASVWHSKTQPNLESAFLRELAPEKLLETVENPESEDPNHRNRSAASFERQTEGPASPSAPSYYTKLLPSANEAFLHRSTRREERIAGSLRKRLENESLNKIAIHQHLQQRKAVAARRKEQEEVAKAVEIAKKKKKTERSALEIQKNLLRKEIERLARQGAHWQKKEKRVLNAVASARDNREQRAAPKKEADIQSGTNLETYSTAVSAQSKFPIRKDAPDQSPYPLPSSGMFKEDKMPSLSSLPTPSADKDTLGELKKQRQRKLKAEAEKNQSSMSSNSSFTKSPYAVPQSMVSRMGLMGLTGELLQPKEKQQLREAKMNQNRGQEYLRAKSLYGSSRKKGKRVQVLARSPVGKSPPASSSS